MERWTVLLLCSWQLALPVEAASPARDDVRLVGGAEAYEGTVQVKTSKGWTIICDDSFNFAAADVVCRQLGYDGAARYTGNNVYGSPMLPWYGMVKCSGLESSLQQCFLSQETNEVCIHKEAAGVVCRAGIWTNCGVGQFQCGSYNLHTCIDREQICDGISHCFDNSDENPQMCGDFGVVQVGSATTNGSGVFGLVRIKHEGRWSTICDDNIEQADAKVICRSLGYEKAVLYKQAILGEGTGIIRNIDASCSGKERWLSECPNIKWDTLTTCVHNEDIGLLCSNRMDVRLAGGSGPEGRVEVFLAGRWGTVCNRDFDHYDAKVVCRMLGFHGDATVVEDTSRFGMGEGPIWLDTLDCNGTETQLESCISSVFPLPKCSHEHDAAVSCSHTRRSTVDEDLAATLMPSSVVCGRITDTSTVFTTSLAKVVRGEPRRRLDTPWLAALYIVKPDAKLHFTCGATVISEWYLLSAGHCFRNRGPHIYIVRVGDFHRDKQDPGEQTFKIEKVHLPPEFGIPFNSSNDIVLLKVAPVGGQGIRFSPTVLPLCLPAEDTDYTSLRNCTAIGWGHTTVVSRRPSETTLSNVPRVARLQIFLKEQCTGPRQIDAKYLRSGDVCAGNLLGGEAACYGDSGGPFSCLGKDGRQYLHGIASRAWGCGQYGYPGSFTKVSKYLRWIRKELETA